MALAAMGRGGTSPNPLVGAVVAKGGRIVGQAFHRRAGEPHAEILALREAGRAARGATLYTNLEPCCHTGRTPPCVEEIVTAGIQRVVSSMRDPDPRVNGGGFRSLRKSGVVVEVGLMKREAAYLNRAFTKFVKERFPFVTLKGAASLDGRIATRSGDSKWITSGEARQHARLLRREHDAVLVGIGTVLADDPRLTARPSRIRGRAAKLRRVVLDASLRLPPGAKLLTTLAEGPVVVFAGPDAAEARARRLQELGATVVRVAGRNGRLDLRGVLRRLAEMDVTRLLVEGGGEIHGSFLEEGLADHLVLYLAPRIIGGRNARALVGGIGPSRLADSVLLSRPISYRVGTDLVVEGDLSA